MIKKQKVELTFDDFGEYAINYQKYQEDGFIINEFGINSTGWYFKAEKGYEEEREIWVDGIRKGTSIKM